LSAAAALVCATERKGQVIAARTAIASGRASTGTLGGRRETFKALLSRVS
jgi:hypothetical protein